MTTRSTSRRTWHRLGILVLIAGSAGAVAQGFPTRPVTVVVPYGPGTGIDLVARTIAQKVTEAGGQGMIVENRPGATGGIGMEVVAKATPDGHTLVIASNSQILNQLVSKVRYDILRDFAPVSLVGSQRSVLAVGAGSPARSIGEFVALAQSSPGKMTYAATNASTFHFMGEMLKMARSIDILMVPYKSSPDAEADLIAGRIDVLFTSMATALPLLRGGKIRVLGVTGDRRASVMPEVPTMIEAGLPSLDVSFPLYLLAPAATPKPAVTTLNGWITKALEARDVRDRLGAAWVEARSSSPEELGTFMQGEFARWGRVVKDTGIRLE